VVDDSLAHFGVAPEFDVIRAVVAEGSSAAPPGELQAASAIVWTSPAVNRVASPHALSGGPPWW
jgi:hypothetical protein